MVIPMKRMFICTLGFDPKFQIRSLIRNNFKDNVKVIVVATPVDAKARNALEDLKKFINEYLTNSSIETIEVRPLDVIDSIIRLCNIFKRKVNEDTIVNISGGMRLLIFETFLAVILSGIKCKVEVELENFMGVAEIPIEVLKVRVDVVTCKILKCLRERRMTTGEIQVITGIPRSTLYRRLKELVNEGIIKKIEEEGIAFYKLTGSGKILYEIKCSNYDEEKYLA